MAFFSEQINIVLNTTPGNQVFPMVQGFTPKVAIFFCNGRNTDGITASSRMSVGFAGTVNQRVMNYREEDAQNPSSSNTRWNDALCVEMMNLTGSSIDFSVSLVSFGAGTFTLNHNNSSATRDVSVTLIGGTDVVDVDVGDFGTGLGATSVVNLGHSVTGVFLVSNQGPEGSGVVAGNARISMGWSDGVNDGAFAMRNRTSQNPAEAYRASSNTKCLQRISSNSQNLSGQSEMQFNDDTGFQLNNTQTYSSDVRVIYLAINGPRCHVTNFSSRVGTGPITPITGVGFAPKMAFLGHIHDSTIVQDRSSGMIGVGMCATDNTKQYAMGTTSSNGASPSDCNFFQEKGSCYARGRFGPDNLVGEIELTSMDPDGATFEQTVETEGSLVAITIMFMGAREFESLSFLGRNLRGNFQ